MDRASDSGSESRGFESLQARQPRRFTRLLGALAALLVLAGILPTLWRALRYEPLRLPALEPDDWHELRLGLHAHSDLSDGLSSPVEVARAARRAGLHALVLTDHDSPELRLAEEAWVDGLLMLVGVELGTDAGHLVAIGMRRADWRVAPEPDEAIQDVHSRGGLAIAAHPTSRRFGWKALDLEGLDGFELINGDTEWREALRSGRLWRAVLYPLSPQWTLLGILSWPTETLALWDGMSQTRAVVGVVGSDAHGGIHSGPIRARWPSYEAVFRMASTHVLLSEPLARDIEQARGQLLAALSRGRAFVVLDGLAPVTGFRFEALTPSGPVLQGGSTPGAEGVRLSVRLPKSSALRLVLLRDGRPFAEHAGGGRFRIEAPGPGVYRAEVHLRHPGLPGSERLPWIVSNAVRIGREVRAPAAELEPPAASRWLWSPTANEGLHVEHDPVTRAVALEEGARGVRFQLGEWTPGAPEVFCAIADRTPRDLAAYRGLVVRIRSDRRSRVELQLRDTDPRDGRDTTWWRATLATGTEPRTLAVDFDRLRPVQQGVKRAFRAESVQSVFVLVSRDRLAPGSQGAFVVESLGLY